jgi:hypothetical protein
MIAPDLAQALLLARVLDGVGMLQQQAEQGVGIDAAEASFDDDAAELDLVACVRLAPIFHGVTPSLFQPMQPAFQDR